MHMSKEYSYWLTDQYFKKIFQMHKNSLDLLEVLFDAIYYAQLKPTVKKKKYGKLLLNLDSVQRIFFFSEKQYFSFYFPFSVEDKRKKLMYYFEKDKQIDVLEISALQSVLEYYREHDKMDIISYLQESDDFSRTSLNYEKIDYVFRKLVCMEFGYVRYDWDKTNENKRIHPLHHLDIDLSDSSTFKVGLDKKISNEEFVDIFKSDVDCWYLKK